MRVKGSKDKMRVIPIESSNVDLESTNLHGDIRWSREIYGESFPRRIIKVLRSKFSNSHDIELDLNSQILNESHHSSYGRPWIMGKFQLDFMKSIGLKPQHKVLDFGCGSGRFGTKAINYLESGGYCGLDSHLPSLLAFAKYEILLHELSDKCPRLFKDENYDFSHFEMKFDWIMDFFVSHHLGKNNYSKICKNAHDVLNSGGKYVMSPPIEEMNACMLENGFMVDIVTTQSCDSVKMFGLDESIDWIVFKNR